MGQAKRNHPDFWGREGRGGEEWDAVDRTPERGEELGGQGFERPRERRPDRPDRPVPATGPADHDDSPDAA